MGPCTNVAAMVEEEDIVDRQHGRKSSTQRSLGLTTPSQCLDEQIEQNRQCYSAVDFLPLRPR